LEVGNLITNESTNEYPIDFADARDEAVADLVDDAPVLDAERGVEAQYGDELALAEQQQSMDLFVVGVLGVGTFVVAQTLEHCVVPSVGDRGPRPMSTLHTLAHTAGNRRRISALLQRDRSGQSLPGYEHLVGLLTDDIDLQDEINSTTEQEGRRCYLVRHNGGHVRMINTAGIGTHSDHSVIGYGRVIYAPLCDDGRFNC
jgi:hypothetical protein